MDQPKLPTLPLTRLFDLFPHQLSLFPKKDAIVSKENGRWVPYSTEAVIERTHQVSLALKNLGVQKGDKLAVMSMNRPEWNFLDLGLLQLGAVNVPIYPTCSDDELRFILEHAEVRLVFIEDKKNLARVQTIASTLPDLKKIYALDPIEGFTHWLEIFASLGPTLSESERKLVQSCQSTVQPDDLASIIYTSGTTGTPKGVMLTHRNLLSNVINARGMMPIDAHCRALSFLPLCHVFERMVNYTYMYLGVSIYYAESIGTIAENLKEVRPMVFVSVPRLIEKLYARIVAKGDALGGVSKRAFRWALQLAEHYDPQTSQGFLYDLKLEAARALVFRAWKTALGGEIRTIISGGAALNSKLSRVFAAAGIPILEGYGLTETSAMSTVNRYKPALRRIGTVGSAVEGVELKIHPEEGYPAGEGEILLRGQNVMKGYYKNEKETTAVLDPDGWFHTGDIGTLIEGKFLKITDRKKEMFKTSGGKYIAPLHVEGLIKESPYVEQVMVLGANQKFPAALILPNWRALKDFCLQQGVASGSRAEMIQAPEVRKLFKSELQKINPELGSWEQIKKFELVVDDWSSQTGELTPTLKLKRKVIQAKYQKLVDQIFNEATGSD